MTNSLSRRFEQLAQELSEIEATEKLDPRPHYDRARTRVDGQLLLKWVVKVKSLIESTCGTSSQYMNHFGDAESGGLSSTNAENLARMKAVFLALHEDFQGGYLHSLRNLVQAEVFDSELEQANELLNKGYKTAAAVIAGTVLETTLRELCCQQQIASSKLDKMNADLAKRNVYNANQAKRITAMAGVRNSAAHGKPNEFSDGDVKTMIDDVERFLAMHLS